MKKLVILSTILTLFIVGCSVHRQQETEQKTYNARLYNKVRIETRNGEIISHTYSDDEEISLKLTKWATGHTLQDAKLNLGKIDVRVKEDTSDSLLKITIKVPTEMILCGCDVELSLPESIFVDLKTSNGKVSVEGHQNGLRLRSSNGEISSSKTAGKLNTATSNGKMRILNHTGDMYCKTSNSDLELVRTVGDADIFASNGRIVVQGHTGNIYGETMNGKVDASVVMPVEDGLCKFISANGEIIVAVRDSVSAKITLRTTNGKIDVDPGFQFTNVNMQNEQFKGNLGEGSGTIYLKTSNGKVSLEKM